MAGALTIDTLNASTNVLATQNGMTGIAKAWVTFQGASGTVLAGFNMSSVTRNSTGIYTLNFTTAMANANYAVTGIPCAGAPNSSFCVNVNSATQYGNPVVKTTSACQIFTGDYASNPRDFGEVYVAVLGS
jgi:hypothetical protein